MSKKNIKTKSTKPKNQIAKKESNQPKNLSENEKIEFGIKNNVELCYAKREGGKLEMRFKNFDKPISDYKAKQVINEFYSAFGAKNALISDVLLDNAISVLSDTNNSINETNLNFAYSFLKEINPQNPLEAMLAIQMLGTHLLSCKTIYRANLSNQTSEGITENINRATKLTRTYIAQMEALKKHRSKGDQKITVEHINVNDGGKVSIGEANTQINNNLNEIIGAGVGTK